MTAYLFGNNPNNKAFNDGVADGYDIAHEPDGRNRYWVVRHLARIGRTEDIAFVHRFDGGDGAIVAVAKITGPPEFDEDGAWVPWNLRVLPPAAWVDGSVLAAEPAWQNRKPFVERSRLFANPIELDVDRVESIARRLRPADRAWLGGGLEAVIATL